ncbi:beta-caryophyllene synthase [Tanacetum coccineum]
MAITYSSSSLPVVEVHHHLTLSCYWYVWLREIQGCFEVFSATDFLRRDDIVVVSTAIEKLDSRNTKGKQEGNVGKTPSSSTGDRSIGNTTAPNKGFVPISVHESPTSDNFDPIRSRPTSYAKLVTGEPSRKSVNFRTLITPARNGVDVAVPLESIRDISERFVNTIYDFFLGKRVAYLVVANYGRNTWGKYGLVKSMLNSSTGLFFFQFSSMDGLDLMLENCPWFIRNNPLILKKWNPDVNFLKEDVGNVSVWVKLYGVPVTGFSEDGLSVIATKLGTPLMLDSYTSDMCMQSWCRSSYARAMIKLRVDVELKDTIVDECPKNIGSEVVKNLKNHSQAPRGVPIGSMKNAEPKKEISNSNPFDLLNSVEYDVDLGTNGRTSKLASKEANSSGSSFWNVGSSSDHDSEDEVELVDNEMTSFLASKRVGYGTNSLLGQCKDTYENVDYDYDPYDDDMHEGREIPDNIQSICDKLDIKVQGRKKKYIT